MSQALHRHRRNCRRALVSGLIWWLILIVWLPIARTDTPPPSPTTTDSLAAHTRYLSSVELTGRGVDTPGIKLARDYIAREFARYGLQPAGENGGYFQPFDVVTGVKVIRPTALAVDGSLLSLNDEWTPLGLSASGKLQGELVFAGYGITAKEYGYDDYEGLDVKGKVVIVLRYEPPPKSDKSPFRGAPQFSFHATLRAKANNAREHGAAAMLLVDLNHSGPAERELISPDRGGGSLGGKSVLAAQISGRAATRLLESHGVSLNALKEKIDKAERPASMALPGVQVTFTVTLEENRTRTQNIVGLIPGTDLKLKQQHVIIGAHYDHIGYGNYGTPDSSTAGKIHNGADDNASGIAALLYVAEQLAAASPKPSRTIVFVAFSGEELGLHGSRYYTRHPPLPLGSAKAMLNLDMVGRLRENRVTVFGARSANELSRIVNHEAHKLSLEVRESDGIGRSDNMSFYNNKVPALHFFTGMHADYHRPSDTWEKLNHDGIRQVADLILGVTREIARSSEPFEFVALPSRPPGTAVAEGPLSRAYFGSIPNYESETQGVKLAGVSPGSPAALAGLREGDVIVQFAGTKIDNLDDLVSQLRSKQPGDQVEIVILRSGTAVTTNAKLGIRG
jgi:aminopeptidase YwaD